MEPHLESLSEGLEAWSEVEPRLKAPVLGWGSGQGWGRRLDVPSQGLGAELRDEHFLHCHLGFFPSSTNRKNQVDLESSQELTPPKLSKTRGRGIFSYQFL